MPRTYFARMVAVLTYLLISVPVLATDISDSPRGKLDLFESSKSEIAYRRAEAPVVRGFVPNQGQYSDAVRFRSELNGATAWFTANQVIYHFSNIVTDSASKSALDPLKVIGLSRPNQLAVHKFVRLNLVGANPESQIIGTNPSDHKLNYFIGNNPDRWVTNVSTYQEIVYRDIYPNIDLAFYKTDRSLEYDFRVGPGADLESIALRYDGIESLSVDDEGRLRIATSFGNITEEAPIIYQEISGERVPVAGKFRLLDDHAFGFQIEEEYDRSRLLIIDPVLIYSTYLGGASHDFGRAAAIDDSGCFYIAGYTSSNDFPVTDAFDSSFNGGTPVGYDIIITKLSASGDSIIYSTYVGGSDGDDRGLAIAVDSTGSAFVSGGSVATDFPTVNALQGVLGGLEDGVFFKLTPAGDSLVFSSYVGGSNGDVCAGIDVGTDGSVYLTGVTSSTDFPTSTTPLDNSLDGARDGFAARIDASGTAFVYSTYLGGTSSDAATAVRVDTSGEACFTGYTLSTDFPLQNAYDSSFNGGVATGDCFLSRLSADGTSLVYSTYFGGADNDVSNALDLDKAGRAVIAGFSYSTDLPMVASFDNIFNGDHDAFVAKFSVTGDSLLLSSYIGGALADFATAVAIDSSGNILFCGSTNSSDFPLRDPINATLSAEFDAFVTMLAVSGDSLIYSTYFGGNSFDFIYGLAIDSASNAFLAGYTSSTDHPLQNPMQPTLAGAFDIIAAKLDAALPVCVDSDGDGFGDPGHPENDCADDNCPSVPNPSQVDSDGDGIGDACDNCPFVPNPAQEDADLDAIGDSCDNCTDVDADGFGDPGFSNNTCLDDNCPSVFNPSQIDADTDGIGDSCDTCTDIDGDGFGNPGYSANTCPVDNCPFAWNDLQEDSDADGAGDSCDTCPSIFNPDQEDADFDGIGDSCDTCTDTDADGFGNPGFALNTCPDDNCPLIFNPDQADADSNGVGDVCDVGCCVLPIRGNIDGDASDEISITDLTFLVAYSFGGGPPPPCLEEGNVDGLLPEGIDIADVTYLVNFMFGGGPSPPACP